MRTKTWAAFCLLLTAAFGILAAAMVLPGIQIEDAFKQVWAQVLKETYNQQRPWESSSLLTAFYFKPGPALTLQPPPATSHQSAQTPSHSAAMAVPLLASVTPQAPGGPTVSGHRIGETFRDCADVCLELVVIQPGRRLNLDRLVPPRSPRRELVLE
jgi:hypothetical protein